VIALLTETLRIQSLGEIDHVADPGAWIERHAVEKELVDEFCALAPGDLEAAVRCLIDFATNTLEVLSLATTSTPEELLQVIAQDWASMPDDK